MLLEPTAADGVRVREVAAARTKLRSAYKLIPARHVPVDLLPVAAQMARDAADLLDREIELRQVEMVEAKAQYDPDQVLYDSIGRRRSPAAMPGWGAGKPSPNRGRTFPIDPPNLDDIMALLDGCHDNVLGQRTYALILVLWRTGLRISEVLRIADTDLHPGAGYITVRRSKNGKGGEVGIDDWVWPLIQPYLDMRLKLPPGPLFCVLLGPNTGKTWDASSARTALHALAKRTGVRRRIAPHQFRHALSVELMIEGKPLLVLQRQLGHANLQVTTVYTRSLPQKHVIDIMRGREMPTRPAFRVGQLQA